MASKNPKINLTGRLLDSIGRSIVQGRYSNNAVFPKEIELCEKYSASRSVIREALKMLASKGLLDSRARKGTWVKPSAEWNVMDPDVLKWMLTSDSSLQLLSEFVEIRLEIEPAAAELAATRGTQDQKSKIHAAIEQMRASNGKRKQGFEADIAFHLAILDASNNRFMQQMKNLVESALRISIALTDQSKGVEHGSIEEHNAIAEAILSGDAKAAREKSYRLIQEAYDLICKRAVKPA